MICVFCGQPSRREGIAVAVMAGIAAAEWWARISATGFETRPSPPGPGDAASWAVDWAEALIEELDRERPSKWRPSEELDRERPSK